MPANARSDTSRAARLRRAPAGWIVLVALLAALGLGIAGWDRPGWPGFVGDEATYLMQAESLGFDGDLLYTRADFDRFVGHWGQPPEGLILQSGDGGRTITYGKPFFYALYAAPFVRAAPRQGAFVANLLLVAVAAFATARTLRPTLGAAAPWAVAAWLFASVAFAYTWWAHSDLFLMGLTALALALAFAPAGDGEARRHPLWRGAAVGALLAIVAYSRPLYLPLFLPAVLAVPRRERWPGWAGIALGALALTGAAGAVHQSLAGSWTSYGAERRGFYSYTGFPAVDFPAASWGENIRDWGRNARAISLREVPAEKKVVPSLFAWNGVYLFAGRHIGLLPYYLPLLLGFLGRPRGWARWSLPVAVALALVAFLWLRPFNFYGGGGAIGNRYFLPLYPAFWFLPSQAFSRVWPVLAAALAAPFMASLWASPRAFQLAGDQTYRFVAPAAQRLLPYETTQSNLKPSGHEDVVHRGLWVKFLDPEVSGDGERLRVAAGGRGSLLVGQPAALAGVRATVRGEGLEVRGGRVRPLGATAELRRLEVRFDRPRARHPMWWTWDEWSLYVLELDASAAPPGATVEVALEPLPAE